MGFFGNFFKVAAAITVATTAAHAVVKVACVGNSITEGYGIWDKKKYPEHLQEMLGDDFQVENFGHSSQMFHKASGQSYWNSAKFTAAYEFGADIVIIELGTNDSKYFFDGKGSSSGYNYNYHPEYKDELYADYAALIDTFAHQSQAPTIFATLQPYAQNPEWGIVDTALVNQINPLIKDVATQKGVNIIDLHTLFNKTEWLLDDVVHPNEEGAKELAQIIANAIQNPVDPASSSSQGNSSSPESSSSQPVAESSSQGGTTGIVAKRIAGNRIQLQGNQAIFTLEKASTVKVQLFDMQGRLFWTGDLQGIPGENSFTLPKGSGILKIDSPSFKSLTLIR